MERWIRLALGFVLAGAPAPANPPTPLQIRPPLEKIAGTVVDEDGRGVGGAKVSAIASIIEPSPRGIAETGPDGSFVILGLYRGVHDLVVEAPGYAKGTMRCLEAGVRDVKIALVLLRAVEGRIFDPASGEGLPNFVLEAREVAQPGSGKFRRTAMGDRAFRGRDGRFVFDGLVPGRYALLARADGYAQAYSREFEIARGRETEPLEIGLSRGGRLVGRLVDGKTENGVSGATITTLDGDFEDSPFVEIFRPYLVTNVSAASTRSSGDGSYVLDHLMPGNYQLEIEHDAYTKRFVEGLLVEEGKATTVPEAPMFRGATVHGTVRYSGGTPVAQAVVSVNRVDRGKPSIHRETTAYVTGAFRFACLPPGTYRLRFQDPQIFVHLQHSICWWRESSPEVELREEGDVEMDLVLPSQGPGKGR